MEQNESGGGVARKQNNEKKEKKNIYNRAERKKNGKNVVACLAEVLDVACRSVCQQTSKTTSRKKCRICRHSAIFLREQARFLFYVSRAHLGGS